MDGLPRAEIGSGSRAREEAPTSQKTLGYVLVVVGIVLLVVGLFADSLGIGSGGGFGWKQIAASVAGVVVAAAGYWLSRRKAA